MTEDITVLHRYHRHAVILLLFLAALLRFYKPDQYPLLINIDELSNIYDGYSFAETGKDRAAESYYVAVRGFGRGDYRPSLMPWLLAAEFKVFGYSVLKGRIFAALLGMISLVLLYFFSREIGGKDFALISLALATFSPWHLIFSRMVHEGTMLPAIFLLLILWLWKRSGEKKFTLLSLALLGFTVGFSVNAYQATRLTGLLLAIIIGIDVLIKSGLRKSFSRVCIWILSVGIGALPQLIFLIFRPDLIFTRSEYALLPYHSFLDFFLNVLRNIFLNLNPVYLFFSFGTPNVFTVARLLPVEAPFFLMGLLLLKRAIKSDQFPPLFFYLLILITILPAAITVYNPHDLRASAFMILAPMISAAGVMVVINFFSRSLADKSISLQRIIYVLFLVAITINAAIYIYRYSQSYELRNIYQQHDLVVLAEKVKEEGKGCSKVFIQDIENQPYIYLTVFTGITPAKFQTMDKSIDTSWIWDHYHQLGKFYFLTKEEIKMEFQNESNEKRLFVYAEKRTDQPAIDSVLSYETGWIYFYIK